MKTPRRLKQVESELYVYLDLAGHPVLCGVLRLDDSDAQHFFAQFTYVQSYLENPQAFPLDPLNLPLIDAHTVFRTTSRYQTLGALFDAAPDAWGRNVMRIDNGGQPVSENAVLLKGRGLGVGAIFFSSQLLSATVRQTVTVPDIARIDALADLLADIDAGIRPKAVYRDLLGSSWDIGGARPKTIVRDDTGQLWIAKFPRRNDSYDRQRVEYANLAMARDIGLSVPDTRLVATDLGAVLLSRRFDRTVRVTPSEILTTRRHYLSGAALISPPASLTPRDIDTPRGQAVYAYARLADVARRISSNPVKDLKELYARMLLNVAVHNTDDHLKNIGFLKDEHGPGYRLAPIFDVVTQEGSAQHTLHVGTDGRAGTFANALTAYSRFGLRSATAAESIVQAVRQVVADRQRYYTAAGLGAEDVKRVEAALAAWRGNPR